MERYYTTKEVCDLFRRKRETIRRWIKKLGFPEPVHHGHLRGRALYPIELVNAWDAAHRNDRL
jgi:predicted DNA-binding transcriptional regulator AlpA